MIVGSISNRINMKRCIAISYHLWNTSNNKTYITRYDHLCARENEIDTLVLVGKSFSSHRSLWFRGRQTPVSDTHLVLSLAAGWGSELIDQICCGKAAFVIWWVGKIKGITRKFEGNVVSYLAFAFISFASYLCYPIWPNTFSPTTSRSQLLHIHSLWYFWGSLSQFVWS